ncbi:MAG: RNA 2',3'-cyclic phosphodiesterase [Candidatus Latescibacteria bacterium]|nr:RNA 2',3'-cyclic phosphodiesterase [bacterium]MBD3423841.1 RNA 2',3'-cyclic phosphodiesterase [Candidatus Latescibacterota bacterium]
MRLFFGIPVSENVRRSVAASISELGLGRGPFRWVPTENFHFTLKFLGETGQEKLPEIKEAALEVSSEVEGEFTATLDQFGAFPSLSRPRVIFYSLSEGGGSMTRLAGEIDRAMSSLGFRREKRAFHPHLTLARIKKPLSQELLDKLSRVPPLAGENSQEVGSFQLIRSHLSRSGARYEKIAEFAFQPR